MNSSNIEGPSFSKTWRSGVNIANTFSSQLRGPTREYAVSTTYESASPYVRSFVPAYMNEPSSSVACERQLGKT